MTENKSFFNTRSFAQVLEDGSREKLRRKIGGAFLYENTTTYFFSRTNFGKSFLAFQVGYAAATGTHIDPCAALCNECEPMKVVVFDLEMDAKTLFDRHSPALTGTDPSLLANLVYLHERIDNDVVIGFELLDKIEEAAIVNHAKLIIIDNISKLLPDSLKADTVTRVITTLNRIREKTGASFLVIGHTTKGDPKTAISPTSYYGSSALQNFFTEIFFLDAARDGRFFLCHAKTKREECYSDIVPVLSRGRHPVCGVGFTFEQLMPLSEVQLPLVLAPQRPSRRIPMTQFRYELSILDRAGVKRNRMAEMCNVNRSAISRVFENTPES